MDNLSLFFWEKMIGSVSSRFTDLLTIGHRLEEGIKIGNVSKSASESSNGANKSFRNFQKKKEGEIIDVSNERGGPHCRPQYYDQPQVAVVAPMFNAQPIQVPQRQAVGQN
ncbi:unnamed protein product [Vicia faba]|uniref:Uncharacterized protein n=1 Tax=Vicia faba TaxID=3906 RepID=A0AAV1B8G9_VICFA|nr:unnamed protein product [Vicia faba]